MDRNSHRDSRARGRAASKQDWAYSWLPGLIKFAGTSQSRMIETGSRVLTGRTRVV
jgi:hypothetical protein